MGTHLFEQLPPLMQQYAVQIGKMVSLAAQKAALAGGTDLAAETPVDTGVARSNWVLTLEAPFGGVIPAYVPYPSYRDNHHSTVKTAVVRTQGRRLTPRNFSPKSFGTP